MSDPKTVGEFRQELQARFEGNATGTLLQALTAYLGDDATPMDDEFVMRASARLLADEVERTRLREEREAAARETAKVERAKRVAESRELKAQEDAGARERQSRSEGPVRWDDLTNAQRTLVSALIHARKTAGDYG